MSFALPRSGHQAGFENGILDDPWLASTWGCFNAEFRLNGDASMFDDLFSAFVMQGFKRKNPTLVGVFVRVRSPELFQVDE